MYKILCLKCFQIIHSDNSLEYLNGCEFCLADEKPENFADVTKQYQETCLPPAPFKIQPRTSSINFIKDDSGRTICEVYQGEKNKNRLPYVSNLIQNIPEMLSIIQDAEHDLQNWLKTVEELDETTVDIIIRIRKLQLAFHGIDVDRILAERGKEK